LFCPTCRKSTSRKASGGLCAYCGDPLIAEGYCPVCEAFLPLPAGAPCPKHQIALESQAPPRLSAAIADQSTAWVEVGRFADALACQPPRIRLEAEGIPTMIDGERMGDRSMYQVATGGVRLRVPEEFAGDARIILSQTWSATAAALDIEDDWPDFDDDPPSSGLDEHHSTAEPPAGGGGGMLALGLAIMLAAVAFLSWFRAS
jgi:hypothetical protein